MRTSGCTQGLHETLSDDILDLFTSTSNMTSALDKSHDNIGVLILLNRNVKQLEEAT